MHVTLLGRTIFRGWLTTPVPTLHEMAEEDGVEPYPVLGDHSSSKRSWDVPSSSSII